MCRYFKTLLCLTLIIVPATCDEDEESSTPTPEFNCPSGSEGFLPHPEYCDRYFECRSGKVVRRKLCADGLVFDPDKSPEEDPCDYIHNVKDKCKTRAKLQTPQPGDGNCPRQNGVFPSPDSTECDKFYSCLNGLSTGNQCAEGLHFDSGIGTCVWARESKRKGCLSATKRAQRETTTTERSTNVGEIEKEGQSLPNGFKCPGGKLGIHPALPHPTSCRLYYVCLNGVVPNEAGCVSGLVFNRDTAKCDLPDNVQGCEDTYATRRRGTTTTKQPAKQTSQQTKGRGGVSDLAEILTVLSNPKFKNFLKPEIVEVLDAFGDYKGSEEDEEVDTDEAQESQKSSSTPTGLRRRRKKLPQSNSLKKKPLEESINPNEYEGYVTDTQRNEFSSKFVPRIVHQSEKDGEEVTRTSSQRFKFPRPQKQTKPQETVVHNDEEEEDEGLAKLGEEMIKNLLTGQGRDDFPVEAQEDL